MARNGKEEMAWKPRHLRKQDIEAHVAHLQRNLPPVGCEVFAGDESRVEAVQADPASSPKKSKFAVLLWEPRGEGRNS